MLNKQDNTKLHSDTDILYDFIMINKNGYITKSSIYCCDWLYANRVKYLLLKSHNFLNVDFDKH